MKKKVKDPVIQEAAVVLLPTWKISEEAKLLALIDAPKIYGVLFMSFVGALCLHFFQT